MAEADGPSKMEPLGKKRTFTTITTTANNLIKKCKNALDEDKLAVLLEGLEEATREYMSIMLEKLELPEIIVHEPKAKMLYQLDIAGLFCLEKPEVEQAKVNLRDRIKGSGHKFNIWTFGLGIFDSGQSSKWVWASQANGPKVGTRWKTK